MANLCSFSMQVNGKRENIEKFYNAMQQNGDVWMGRGAEADIIYEDDDNRAFIDGWCKWSIQSSLIDNALSMEKQRTTGEGIWYWEDEIKYVKEFLTLWKACEKFNVNVDIFSEEPGCCFQEHYKYENGNITNDCTDYYEYSLVDYETKEEAEDDLGIKITDEEWKDEDYISRGGYEWDFDLLDVI